MIEPGTYFLSCELSASPQPDAFFESVPGGFFSLSRREGAVPMVRGLFEVQCHANDGTISLRSVWHDKFVEAQFCLPLDLKKSADGDQSRFD